MATMTTKSDVTRGSKLLDGSGESYLESLKFVLALREEQAARSEALNDEIRRKKPNFATLQDRLQADYKAPEPLTDHQTEQAIRLLIRMEMPESYRDAALAWLDQVMKRKRMFDALTLGEFADRLAR